MENCLMNLVKKSERFYISSRLVLVSIDIYSMIECQVSNVICYNFFTFVADVYKGRMMQKMFMHEVMNQCTCSTGKLCEIRP